MKSYTDIEQSKKLAEILPLESADMAWCNNSIKGVNYTDKFSANLYTVKEMQDVFNEALHGWDKYWEVIPCWSLVTLFSLIKDKCGYFEFVYLKRTSDGRANLLKDVYRLSTDIYDVYNKEAVDACYEMILKLHELNLL